MPAAGPTAGHDPYGGVFFSKDRREEVVEVDEKPESFQLVVAGKSEEGEVCTFGEWMRGCPEKGEQESVHVARSVFCRWDGSADDMLLSFQTAVRRLVRPHGRCAQVPLRRQVVDQE